MALSLNNFPNPTKIGSQLFHRGCSGSRVVSMEASKTIGAHHFDHYGAHYTNYPHPYLVIAAAIGQKQEEIDKYITKLDKILSKEKTNIANK